jgi:hypothetical protein
MADKVYRTGLVSQRPFNFCYLKIQKQYFFPDESNTLVKSKPLGGPRSIKFTVRTKGQNDDKPIELEIEIKDQVWPQA